MASYIHGHHPSVLRSHTWRTVKNSSAYMVPHLETLLKSKPDLRILDIGCGPGTITCDLASLYPSTKITGIDASEDIVAQATSLAKERTLSNVDFATGDIFHLAFEDETFDVIHVHQVIQHIPNPVDALKELRRVLKKGGFLAAREVDFPAARWYPPSPVLDEWLDVYNKVAEYTGGTPDMGRRIHALARQAGFAKDNVHAGVGTWCFNTVEDREWWSSVWAERVVKSEFRKKALDSGVCGEEELQKYSEAWQAWGKEEDGWHLLVHGEVVCFK